jgi:hypothetical protein
MQKMWYTISSICNDGQGVLYLSTDGTKVTLDLGRNLTTSPSDPDDSQLWIVELQYNAPINKLDQFGTAVIKNKQYGSLLTYTDGNAAATMTANDTSFENIYQSQYQVLCGVIAGERSYASISDPRQVLNAFSSGTYRYTTVGFWAQPMSGGPPSNAQWLINWYE